jgi:hypothetical protein
VIPFYLFLGICLENLAKPDSIDLNKDNVEYILKSINHLLNSSTAITSLQMKQNQEIFIELLSILYRYKNSKA